MLGQQDLNRYVGAVSHHLGLEIVEPDATGCFSLPMQDQPDIVIALQDDCLLIRCDLGLLWGGDDATALLALEANLLGRHSFGGVLGINTAKELLIWFRVYSLNSEKEFIGIVEMCAAGSKLWQQTLKEACSAQS